MDRINLVKPMAMANTRPIPLINSGVQCAAALGPKSVPYIGFYFDADENLKDESG